MIISRKQAKLQAIEALIERDSTPIEECEAAKRAYKRLTGKDYVIQKSQNTPMCSEYSAPVKASVSTYNGSHASSTVDWLHAEYDEWSQNG